VYDEILMLMSNHEERLWKVVVHRFQEKTVSGELIKRLKTLQEIFEENELDKITCVDHYLFQIGNIIVSHFENNSTVPGSVPRWVVLYLIPRISKPWDVCFQAHTHCQSKISIDRKLVVETGVLTDSLDYWVKGKMSGKGKLSTIGYAICNMVNGKANLNDCNFVVKEWQGHI